MCCLSRAVKLGSAWTDHSPLGLTRQLEHWTRSLAVAAGSAQWRVGLIVLLRESQLSLDALTTSSLASFAVPLETHRCQCAAVLLYTVRCSTLRHCGPHTEALTSAERSLSSQTDRCGTDCYCCCYLPQRSRGTVDSYLRDGYIKQWSKGRYSCDTSTDQSCTTRNWLVYWFLIAKS